MTVPPGYSPAVSVDCMHRANVLLRMASLRCETGSGRCSRTRRNCRSLRGVPMSLAVCWQSRARSPCCTAICITTILHGSRGWLAIDPKGLLGERTYEVANLLGNPWPHGEIVHQADRMLRLSTLYASRLDLDPRRVLGFALAHAGLSASWSLEDGSDPSYRLTCAAILDPLVT